MNKSITLLDFRRAVEELWPAQQAENWDRVGLVAGADSAPVQKILLAVDAVRATTDEAVSWGADVLFTHHPLMLRGVHTIAEDTYKGAILADLIRANCALLAAHTNADVPIGGVSDVLAHSLELVEVEPIEPGLTPESGLGRTGLLPQELTLEELAVKLTGILPRTAVGARVAGDPQQKIKRVALLGGAGDSMLGHPKVRAADVYITSDLRHHPAQEALEQSLVTGGPALIDVAHWASESLWLEEAARLLRKKLPGVETRVSEINTDPWRLRVG